MNAHLNDEIYLTSTFMLYYVYDEINHSLYDLMTTMFHNDNKINF